MAGQRWRRNSVQYLLHLRRLNQEPFGKIMSKTELQNSYRTIILHDFFHDWEWVAGTRDSNSKFKLRPRGIEGFYSPGWEARHLV